MQIRPGLGYLRSKLLAKIRSVTQIRVGQLILGLLTLFFLAFNSLYPALRTADGTLDVQKLHSNWGLCLLLLAGMLYLKYKDAVIGRLSKRVSPSWKRSLLGFAAVLEELDLKAPRSSQKTQRLREDVLRSAVAAVAHYLGVPAEELCGNLILFHDDVERMTCVARSDRSRTHSFTIYSLGDRYYPGVVAREDRPRIVNDTRHDPAWEGARPPYRSVFYVPLSRNLAQQRLTYGTMTIDSLNAYAFHSNQDELDTLLRPYLAILCLTFSDKDLRLNKDPMASSGS